MSKTAMDGYICIAVIALLIPGIWVAARIKFNYTFDWPIGVVNGMLLRSREVKISDLQAVVFKASGQVTNIFPSGEHDIELKSVKGKIWLYVGAGDDQQRFMVSDDQHISVHHSSSVNLSLTIISITGFTRILSSKLVDCCSLITRDQVGMFHYD